MPILFITCPACGRLMLGQNGRPQLHECPPKERDRD